MNFESKIVTKHFIDQFIIQKEMAIGSTAIVYQARTSSTQMVVLKKFIPEMSNLALKEYMIAKDLFHPYICRCIGYKKDAKYFTTGESLEKCSVLMMEYVAHGQLFDLVAQFGPLNEAVARTYFHQIIQALEYIHENRIAHLDLKLENLLVDENFNIKVTDFGLSVLNSKHNYKIVGTQGYIAPEIYMKNGYDGFLADIFSAGVILFIMIVGEIPFNDTKQDVTYKNLSQAPQQFWRVYEDKGLKKNFKNLIENILKKNPNERFSLKQIKQHQWYKGEILQNGGLSREIGKYFHD